MSSFRQEISFFKKGPTLCTFTWLSMQLPEQTLIGGASGKTGEASLLHTSLGFLANKATGPKASTRHHRAARLSGRALARMAQMQTS